MAAHRAGADVTLVTKLGKDMMGTMSNTLILAFTGGAINTMILIYAYMMPYLQIINMYSIGIEVIKGISGTLGIILTVPLVSVISAWMYGKKNPHESKSNEE